MGFYNYNAADMKNNREIKWKPSQMIGIEALVDIQQRREMYL